MAAQKKRTALPKKKNRSQSFAKPNLAMMRTWLAQRIKAFVYRVTRLPRPLQIFTIYLLTVVIVGGFFLWRLSSMQIENPYTSENTPRGFEHLWGDYAADSEPVTRPEDPVELQPGEDHGEEEGPAAPPGETQLLAPVYPEEEVIAAFNATWPVQGELLYGFHDPKSQVLVPPYSSHRYSKGVVIKTVPGAEVIAVESGTVISVVKIDYPRGSSVTIRHNDVIESYYGGLSEVSVTEGSSVSRGQLLGFVSTDVIEEDPGYFYLEIRENRIPVDPLLHLAAGR